VRVTPGVFFGEADLPKPATEDYPCESQPDRRWCELIKHCFWVGNRCERKSGVLATAPIDSSGRKTQSPACGGIEAFVGSERRCLKPKYSFRDCLDCPEMVVVPAGSFMMGSPASDRDRLDNEGPQHKVTIANSLAVGKYEVTFAEWDACVAAGGCKHNPLMRAGTVAGIR